MPDYSPRSNYDMAKDCIGALAAQVIAARNDLSTLSDKEIIKLYCTTIDHLMYELNQRSIR